MKIRNYNLKDRKAISKLYYDLHPIEEKANKEKGLLVPIKKSQLKSLLFVAEENKTIMGFIWAHFVVYGFFKYGTIDEFFVKKEFRNRGIGKRLVKKVMQQFKTLKAKIVLIGTEKENKEAIKLYEDLGFEIGKNSIWFYWNP